MVGRSARHTLTVELLARTAQNAGLWVRDLVRWMKEKGKVYMHPVVQEVTREKAAPGVKDCERLIDALTDKLYCNPGDNPLEKQGYVGYAAALLGNIAETHEKVATLANNVSTIYYTMGQLEKALEFQLKALAIREQVLAKNHPDLAQSYHNLSTIYFSMQEIPRALPYAQKAVDIWQSLFPNGHPNLEKARENLEILQLLNSINKLNKEPAID